MNRMQKIAWLMVISITTGLILSAIAITVLYFIHGFPKAWSGTACLGIIGFAGLGPIIFKKDKGPVELDERDHQIGRRAAIAGFASAYLVVGLACMLPFTILGSQATVPVTWLPNIFAAAGISNFYFHSIAILVQYGRGGQENE